jgi:hypothetical protein
MYWMKLTLSQHSRPVWFGLVLCFETGSHYEAQAGLEIVILLPQSPKSRVAAVCHHTCWDSHFDYHRTAASHSGSIFPVTFHNLGTHTITTNQTVSQDFCFLQQIVATSPALLGCFSVASEGRRWWLLAATPVPLSQQPIGEGPHSCLCAQEVVFSHIRFSTLKAPSLELPISGHLSSRAPPAA